LFHLLHGHFWHRTSALDHLGVPVALVRVVATHGRSAWSGRLAFPLGGSEHWAGASVPYEVTVQPNIYTVAMAGGGLAGAALQRIYLEPPSWVARERQSCSHWSFLLAEPGVWM